MLKDVREYYVHRFQVTLSDSDVLYQLVQQNLEMNTIVIVFVYYDFEVPVPRYCHQDT